jgi:hypothetical protein
MADSAGGGDDAAGSAVVPTAVPKTTRRAQDATNVDAVQGGVGAAAVWLGVLLGIPDPEQLDPPRVTRVRQSAHLLHR